MDLAVDDHRVDHVAAVVDRDVALEVAVAGLGIDLDHGAVSAERPHEVARVVVRDSFEALLHPLGKAGAVRGERHLAERLALVGTALDIEVTLVEGDVLLSRLKEVRGDLSCLVGDLLARLVHGHAAHRQRATAIGSIAERRPLSGIAVPQLDGVVAVSYTHLTLPTNREV